MVDASPARADLLGYSAHFSTEHYIRLGCQAHFLLDGHMHMNVGGLESQKLTSTEIRMPPPRPSLNAMRPLRASCGVFGGGWPGRGRAHTGLGRTPAAR